MKELLQSSEGGELGHQGHPSQEVAAGFGAWGGEKMGGFGFSEVLSVPKVLWRPNCGLPGPEGEVVQ